jgi:hypothetical protein
MQLKDYPTLNRDLPSVDGKWNGLDQERGAAVKAASKHLSKFARWYERSQWFGRVKPDIAASLWCKATGLRYKHAYAGRWAFQQVLGQLYEQHVLKEVGHYPPHVNQDRLWFNIFPSKGSKKKARAPGLVLA